MNEEQLSLCLDAIRYTTRTLHNKSVDRSFFLTEEARSGLTSILKKIENMRELEFEIVVMLKELND